MDFLKLLKPTATHSRNGFDLSRKHVFSLKAGQAKPCLFVETVPNDHFEIDLASLTRTMTMNTAAFLRGKMRYDFFFVPYTQLWHPFNQFISQRTDKHSSLQKSHNYCPVIQISNLLLFLSTLHASTDARRLDVHGYAIVPQILDMLNLMGYGDYRWILDPNMSASDKVTNIAKYVGKYVNVWRLAAYQHVWYDFYRNKYYDVDDTGGIAAVGGPSRVRVDMFNFDDIDCSTFANSVIPCDDIANLTAAELDRLVCLLQPRFVQWKKDLFTSSLPGQQFGIVSSVDVAGVSGNDYQRWANVNTGQPLTGNEGVLTAANGTYLKTGTSGSGMAHTHTLLSTFDVLNLRKAEMLQLWKQRTLRAGNQVDDNFKAHYGTESYYEGDNVVNYIGSFASSLQVNPVETTGANPSAGVANKQVGDLAATGTAVVSGNKINFSPRDFGVIMCIASFLPEAEYNSDGLEKANTLHEQFDYFTPEFENIGLEGIPVREYSFDTNRAISSEVMMGYAPRYWMYKSAVDKVFGEFQSRGFGNSLTAWVSPRQVAVYTSAGAFYQNVSNLYCTPSVLNNIFAIVADANGNTDQFLNNVAFNIKAVRPMSELGLPQF